jgi:Ni,Fe-hydrogenase I large subunit
MQENKIKEILTSTSKVEKLSGSTAFVFEIDKNNTKKSDYKRIKIIKTQLQKSWYSDSKDWDKHSTEKRS